MNELHILFSPVSRIYQWIGKKHVSHWEQQDFEPTETLGHTTEFLMTLGKALLIFFSFYQLKQITICTEKVLRLKKV